VMMTAASRKTYVFIHQLFELRKGAGITERIYRSEKRF
jgi:hypothetical protein